MLVTTKVKKGKMKTYQGRHSIQKMSPVNGEEAIHVITTMLRCVQRSNNVPPSFIRNLVYISKKRFTLSSDKRVYMYSTSIFYSRNLKDPDTGKTLLR